MRPRSRVELTDWRRRNVDPKEFLLSETERLASEAKARAEADADALLEKQNDVDQLSVQDLFHVWLRDGVRRKDGNAELQRSFKADVLPADGLERQARAVVDIEVEKHQLARERKQRQDGSKQQTCERSHVAIGVNAASRHK